MAVIQFCMIQDISSNILITSKTLSFFIFVPGLLKRHVYIHEIFPAKLYHKHSNIIWCLISAYRGISVTTCCLKMFTDFDAIRLGSLHSVDYVRICMMEQLES